MNTNFSEYYKSLIPYMQELWKEVFLGGNGGLVRVEYFTPG